MEGCLKKSGSCVNLTTTEQALLNELVKSVNRPITREELMRLTQTKSLRTIDVQIARLRRKIESDPKHPFWIQTVRGKGYKLVSS